MYWGTSQNRVQTNILLHLNVVTSGHLRLRLHDDVWYVQPNRFRIVLSTFTLKRNTFYVKTLSITQTMRGKVEYDAHVTFVEPAR